MSTVYWIASTRSDGRPPTCCSARRFGARCPSVLRGQSEGRALPQHLSQSQIAVHIGDGHEAIIVEGVVEIEKPTEEMAQCLSDEMFDKYPQCGRIDASRYAGGITVVRPTTATPPSSSASCM